MKKQKLKRINIYNTICFIFLCAILFTSCNQEKRVLTKGLTGEFIIESMLSNDKGLLYNFSINQFSLKEDNTIEIPRIVDRAKEGLKEDTVTTGSWIFFKKDGKYYLNLTTGNIYFNGTYRFYFIDARDRNHLKLVLENENTKIVSGKNYFYYRQNVDLVNKLVKYTQGKVMN